jgi:hypothetical protein
MTCTLIKDKVSKTFIDEGAMSPSNKILDHSLFDYLNKRYSKEAQEKYDLDTLEMMFTKKGNQAVANSEFMDKLDRLANPTIEQDERFEAESEDASIIEKITAARRIERGYQKLFSKLEGFTTPYTPTQEDTLDTTEDKIERLQQALDAVVVIDTNQESSGVLLGANHPLTKSNGKPTIVINPNKLFDDTIIHEFGHLYIDLLGGLKDPVVAAAIENLQGSKLWNDVAEAYPELKDEALAKEVLATAIGFEGNNIYNSPEQESIWQQIKNTLLNMLAKLFNYKHDNKALQQLATELVKNKVRVNNTQAYNTQIDQQSKLNIPKEDVSQKTIDALFNHLTETFNLDEETHTYKNKSTNEVFNSSVSTVAKNMRFNRNNWNHKGDYTMEYDPLTYTLTTDNYERIFSERKIPWALDKALTAYFAGYLSKSQPMVNDDPESVSWYNYYTKQSGKDVLFNIPTQDLDVINAAALEEEKVRSIPALAGTKVHLALENYVKHKNQFPDQDLEFPDDIIDTDGKLFATIKDVIDKGIANGSKFYTEQLLFSETAKKPGTADLIEITKEGEFRIYDFKTTNSFKDRLGNEKSDWLKYIEPGYLNQLIIYSTILEEYNLSPAKNSMNIIAIEVDNSQFDPENPDTSPVTITDVVNKNIDPTDKYFVSHYKQSKRQVVGMFRSRKKLKEEYNVETKEMQLNKIALRIQRGIEDYKKKTDIKTGKFTTTDARLAINPEIYGLGEQVDELVGKHNELILFKYVDTMREALKNVYQDMNDHDAMLTSAYVANVTYLLQMASFIPGVKKFLDAADDSLIDADEMVKLVKALDETDDAIRRLEDVHTEKKKELAINTLVANSDFTKGAIAEQYEMEARNKEGLTKKEDIAAYVHKKLQDPTVQEKIDYKEYQKWNDLLHNGYTDTRLIEDLFADPGMHRSQFVQVVKNILDKVDNDVRVEIDKSIPEIVKWRESLKFDTTGDPAKIWGKFFETASYKSVDNPNKTIEHAHASVIPEFTSEYRKHYLRFQHKLDHINRELSKAHRDKKQARIKKLEKIREEFIETKDSALALLRADEANLALTVHPKFAALSKEEQDALRYIHKKLEHSDTRLYTATNKKLVRELAGGVKLYNLPKMRKTILESSYNKAGMMDRFKSALQDMRRPPADEDELNLTDEEMEDGGEDLKAKNTDILGETSYDVPVFYRNQLEDPTLQSLDIPTLLAMNEETTIAYEQHKMVEADLFMITQSLKSSDALKSDSFVAKKIVDNVKGFLPKDLKSEENRTLKVVQASINNRFYKRSYAGVYSKQNYMMIKAGQLLGSATSSLLLGLNFRSGAMTGIQGTIYRMVEGVAGEHFTMDDVKKGSAKAYGDIRNILADSQEHFPKSKTILLIRRFGLETQYKALVNKFVQDNFVTKNMDSASIFTVTTMAETMVTASLMYTLMSNIKVINEKGDFIDKNGVATTRENAMSLDEAYTVVDGILELNPKVAYTEKNLVEKLSDDTSIASTQISGYIRSIYADLFGQYNQDMKSMIEMTVAGKLVMSMRKWLPRGMHRRWRGITSVSQYTFEELKKEENWDKRFFSQDQGKFQEGYYATGARYVFSMLDELKTKGFSMSTAKSAGKNVYSTMNTHERANIKRLGFEAGIMAMTVGAALFLAGLAKAMGEEDDDKRNDKIYFLLYLMERLKMESLTFINPFEAIDLASNPAASMSVIKKIKDLILAFVGIGYEDNGDFDWAINDRYERGPRKGELKINKHILGFIPGYKNGSQFMGILGYDSSESIEDTYEYTQR